MFDETHHLLMEALESRSYKRLQVNRMGRKCWLIVTLDDGTHVFVDRLGKRVEYSHAWQVREWLKNRFGIPESDVPVDVVLE
jgi:hypothetical protein